MNIKKNSYIILFLFVLLLLFLAKEMNIQKASKGKTVYGFSLEEIRERIECIYKTENVLRMHTSSQFGELGRLPQGKCVDIHIYLAKGNRILFLPESKANMEMDKGGETYKVYYSEEMKGYLFYLMCDWGVHESGVPLNSLESSSFRYCMVSDSRNTHPADVLVTGVYDGLYDIDSLSYLGRIKADFSEDHPSNIHPFEVSDNGYINIMAEYVADKLAQAGEYGKYVIYLNDMHRIQQETRSFGETECYMDCVIEGNGRKEYAEFIIYDHGNIDESIFPLSGPHLADSQGYFSDYSAEDENREYIEKIIERERGVVTLEVTRQAKENIIKKYSDSEPICDNDIDFRVMPAEELARKISYVCSYSEWFGMAELGSCVGKFSEFDGQNQYRRDAFLYSGEQSKYLSEKGRWRNVSCIYKRNGGYGVL